MLVYIDADYKCHLSDDGTRRAVDADFLLVNAIINI